jgi:tRNA pseudouridine55 synthase
LLEADKAYVATVRLGVTTTTGDLEGEITARHPVEASREDIERALKLFAGEIRQTPPMYSALKWNGKPLYAIARAGGDVPRAPRSIMIHKLDLLEFENGELRLFLSCSKGTYVRVLAEDLGRVLGCGACLSGLRREDVGDFRLSKGAVRLEQVERMAPAERDALLLPADVLVSTLPRLDLDPQMASRLSHGQVVAHISTPAEGLARIYGPGGAFLGVAEVRARGEIVPRRLMSKASAAPANEPSIA